MEYRPFGKQALQWQDRLDSRAAKHRPEQAKTGREQAMTSYPVHIEGEGAQAAYHIVPDPVRGGWNVYATNEPQEPQRHFATKEQAIAHAEQLSLAEGVGFTVDDQESRAQGH